MKIISLFNNKGGVGKTTLAYHLAHSFGCLGYNVLMIDLDPQCNLTINSISENQLLRIWEVEDKYIDDYGYSMKRCHDEYIRILNEPRTIHFLLKPIEEGLNELEKISPPIKLNNNVNLIPGRLSLHKFENKIAESWNSLYSGDPEAIRLVTAIRRISELYANKYEYDFIVIDTSPSLGILNKVIISTVDGFFIPCQPDMFSLYGIRNIGENLQLWKKEFNNIYALISKPKRAYFPKEFVQFLGYTIYNAKRNNKSPRSAERYNLALAHFNYVKKIPKYINKFIKPEVRLHLEKDMITSPIGGEAIMHSHNTFPSMSQKYKAPFWDIPKIENLEENEKGTIRGNHISYESTKNNYLEFTKDLLKRIATLDR